MLLGRFILRLVCSCPPSLLEFIYIGPLVEDHGLLFIFALRSPGIFYVDRCLCPCPGRGRYLPKHATFYTLYARLFSAKKRRGMILIERLCGERRVKFPVVSEASESTVLARVDSKSVGVSLVWLMTPSSP
jgi:hypothetical protein